MRLSNKPGLPAIYIKYPRRDRTIYLPEKEAEKVQQCQNPECAIYFPYTPGKKRRMYHKDACRKAVERARAKVLAT